MSEMKMSFGKFKGQKIKTLPKSYLEFIVKNFDSGSEVSICAQEVLDTINDEAVLNLEQQADEFLKAHGVDPKKL
jgi:uncharacterized protein (DUF3820 family)